ncbi:MAG: hypothetical protein JWQ03_1804 [Variovorax sp.]|nr:hypothetical protein [Variovorax sp.]
MMQKATIHPFSEGEVHRLATARGDLEIESSLSAISFMSDFDIRRDRQGLALATQLRDLLEQVVAQLAQDEQAGRLPERLALAKTTLKDNPLA